MTAHIAILASGEGTTAEAFIRACAAQQVDAVVELVICNKPDAGIFDRVLRLNKELDLAVDAIHISAQTNPPAAGETPPRGGQTAPEEAAILLALSKRHIDLVLLMGYLRRVGPRLVREYGWREEYTSPYQARMLNTHPGLLPETKGLWGVHVQEHVIQAGRPYGGQTLHVVAEDYDDGPVIAVHQVAVEPNDTPETFFDRVKTAEKASLPSDIQAFIHARENFMQQQKEAV